MDKALTTIDAKKLLNDLSTEYNSLIDKRKTLETECQDMKKKIGNQVSQIQEITKEIIGFREELKKFSPNKAQNLDVKPPIYQQTVLPGVYQQPIYQQNIPVQQPQEEVQQQPEEQQEEQTDEKANFVPIVPVTSITHPCSVSLFIEITESAVVCSTAFSPDGDKLAIGSNKIIHVYSLKEDKFILRSAPKESEEGESPEVNYVRTISWMPNSTRLLCGFEDHSIYVYDIKSDDEEENNTPVKIIEAGDGEVFHVICFPDGKKFASSTNDGKIKIWDAETFECLSVLTRSADGSNLVVASAMALSPDAKILAAGYSDFCVAFWDVEKSEMIFEKKCHTQEVYSVIFTPDSKRFITSSLDRTIKIWDVLPDGLELWKVLDKHEEYVLTLAIDPTGQWLISGSKDKSCIVTRLDEGRMLYSLNNHENSVITISFNPNGRKFCTGSGDRYVKIWDFVSE